jgi:hypothetical protein
MSMEMKELDSMKKHRGLFLALGFAALIGLSAGEARAENVTLVLSWTGGSLTIDQTSAFAQAGSSANLLTVNTDLLNGFLSSNGSNYTFSELGASSNNPGDPTGSILRETGTAILSGTGGDSTITVHALQDSFTSPSGTGTLQSTSTANFTDVPTGTSVSNSSLDATLTPTITYTSTGIDLNSHSDGNSVAATGSASGYTLDNTTVISLTGGPTASDQFSVAAKFTSNAIPEPAGLVMMLTGMPLPLVVIGLLRRRAKA